jgi:PAS domain S-box-containing protein
MSWGADELKPLAFLGEAGEALARGEDHFRAVLDVLPAGVCVTDADGLITYYNQAAARLWGRHPELGIREWCATWSDGLRVSVYSNCLYDESGKLTGAVNLLVDDSERKRVEGALSRRVNEQAVQYRFTARLQRAGSLTDLYEAALDAILQVLGCERAAILLMDGSDVMRFVAWRGLSDRYRGAVEGHSPWPADARDPQPICLGDVARAQMSEALKAIVKDEGVGALAFVPLVENGKLVGKFMTYYDLRHVFTDAETELALMIARQLGFNIHRMRADAARKRAEDHARQLALIVELSDDAILTRDLEGIVGSWNRGAERLFGYMADEIIGRPTAILIPLERNDEEQRVLDRVRRGEHVEHYETAFRHKDGSLLDISVTASPIKGADGRTIGISKIARDITDRKRSEERTVILAREAEHRAKNVLSTVQATVELTQADSVDGFKHAIKGRIQALANAHGLFVQSSWTGADLRDLVTQELSPYCQDGETRVRIDGAYIMLEPNTAQTIAMCVHELATNAAKYGALSVTEGLVLIEWSRAADGRLVVCWTETNGPPVKQPTRQGFGMRVIGSMIRGQLKGDLRFDWRPEGLFCEIALTV